MNKKIDQDAVQELLKDLPDATSFSRKLIFRRDKEQARLEGRKFYIANFNAVYGEELNELDMKIPEKTQQWESLSKQKAILEKQLKETNPTSRKEDTPDRHDRDIRMWLNIGLGIICLFAALFVLGMGAANIFSIILGSGTPVFIENPQLAWMLSALFPIGAFALDFFKRHLSSDRANLIYIRLIFGITALLLLIWVILFALVFGSPASSSLDFEKIMEPSSNDHLATALTIVQLLCELLVGSLLFSISGDLLVKYFPTKIIPNPNYVETKKLLDSTTRDHNEATDALAKMISRQKKLADIRTIYISLQESNFDRLLAQLGD
jgi:hypothetical protein